MILIKLISEKYIIMKIFPFKNLYNIKKYYNNNIIIILNKISI